MTKWCFALVLIALCTAPMARPALASPAPSASNKVKARKLVRLAKRFIKQKQYQRAISTFKQAYRYWARKEIQFNIALVYLELGAKVKAYVALKIFVDASGPGVMSRMPAPLLRLRNQVGVLRVSTPTEGAVIVVDGTKRGTGRVEVVVLPGEHQVEIHQGEAVIQRKSLRVTGGATVVWDAPRKTPRRVVTNPKTPDPPPPSRRKKLHWVWFVSAASLAVVAGAVVVGTGVKTTQLGEDYDLAPSRTLQQKGRRYKLATNVMIGVGSAAAVTAAVLAFVTKWAQKERAVPVTIQPGVTPKGASVSVEFTF